jgi:hypothetical protein
VFIDAQFFLCVTAYGVRFEIKYPSSCPHPKKVGDPWPVTSNVRIIVDDRFAGRGEVKEKFGRIWMESDVASFTRQILNKHLADGTEEKHETSEKDRNVRREN